mgnify:CR=1 FL=1|jgi:hypothetical protein
MKSFATIMLFFSTAVMLSSCNIASVVGYIATPDPQQDALFELQDVSTVVFVDDRRNIMHPTRLRRVVAERVTNDLLTKEILSSMISPRDILRVSASSDRYGSPIAMDELGNAVGANVLIYVEVQSFSLTNDGQTANPTATCDVRVIDVLSRKRLFPEDGESYRVQAMVKNISPHRLKATGEVRKLAEELAENLGDSVAKLFYGHVTGRLGENLNRK